MDIGARNGRASSGAFADLMGREIRAAIYAPNFELAIPTLVLKCSGTAMSSADSSGLAIVQSIQTGIRLARPAILRRITHPPSEFDN